MTERIQELEITAGVYLVRLAPSGEYVAEHDGRETAPLHHTDVAEIRAMVAAGDGGDIEFAFEYQIDGEDE